MAVVDTSWLVALHVTTDQYHAEAAARAQKEPDLLIPDVILGEFLNTMFALAGGKKNHDKASKEVRAILKGIRENNAFRFTNDSEPPATRALFESNAKLSYPDAVAIQVALRERQFLLTFDEAQRDQHENLKPKPGRER